MDCLHYQRHILKYERPTSARVADKGDRSRAAMARIADRLRLVGALGGSHGDGRRNDISDVVGLIVDAERGRSNGHR